MWHKKETSVAGRVSKFMQELHKVDENRYNEAMNHGLPHGDMAYGQALYDWYKKGKPNNAWFSYAPGEVECKLLIAFRKEISEEFGLEILTCEEGEERRKATRNVVTKKVYDWGLN